MKRRSIKRPSVFIGVPIKHLRYPHRLMYVKWSKANEPLKTLLMQLYADLEGLLLGKTLSVDILNSWGGDIIVPAQHKISKILLRNLFYYFDLIEIAPCSIRGELMEIITYFKHRFSEIEIREDAGEAEEFIREHGERWRRLIESALRFLDDEEPSWNLDIPIGRKSYIRELVRKAKKSSVS